MQSRQSRNIFCAYLILCVLPFPVGCSPIANPTQTQNANETQTQNADETQTQQLIGTWQGILQGDKVTITPDDRRRLTNQRLIDRLIRESLRSTVIFSTVKESQR